MIFHSYVSLSYEFPETLDDFCPKRSESFWGSSLYRCIPRRSDLKIRSPGSKRRAIDPPVDSEATLKGSSWDLGSDCHTWKTSRSEFILVEFQSSKRVFKYCSNTSSVAMCCCQERWQLFYPQSFVNTTHQHRWHRVVPKTGPHDLMALAKQRPNSVGIPRWNWLVGFIRLPLSLSGFSCRFSDQFWDSSFFTFFFRMIRELDPLTFLLLDMGVSQSWGPWKYVDVGRCGKTPEDFEDLRPQAMTQWLTVVLSWKIGWKSVSSRLLCVKAEAETVTIRQRGLVLGPAIEFVHKVATQTATKKGLVLAVESHRSGVSQPRPRQCNMDDAPLSMRRQVAARKRAPLCWGMFRVGTWRWWWLDLFCDN
jgi:hypothetical protein